MTRKKVILGLMEIKIWRNLIQILSYRNDLIDIIKPFFDNLCNRNNNENFQNQDEKYDYQHMIQRKDDIIHIVMNGIVWLLQYTMVNLKL